MKRTPRRVGTLVLTSLLFPLAAIGQPADHAQAVIDHIVAIEGLHAIRQDSTCKYILVKAKLPQPPYREVMAGLRESDRREIEQELNSPEVQRKLKQMTNSGREVVSLLGGATDEKTACGLWAGYAFTEYRRTAKVLQQFLSTR